jgi:hypothetical protein
MRSRNHLLLWTLAPVSPGAEEVYIVIYKLNNYIIAYAALQAFLKNFSAISACGIQDNSHTIPGYVLQWKIPFYPPAVPRNQQSGNGLPPQSDGSASR